MTMIAPPGGPSFSGELFSSFRGRRLPVDAYLAGYSALIEAFQLQVPLHHEMAAVAPKNVRRKEDGWNILPISHRPNDDIISHLVFALKYEGVQLLTMKYIFTQTGALDIESAARNKPTSAYIRRICFFFEWLTHRELALHDTRAGSYVQAIDTRLQYAAPQAFTHRRFRIKDNLPGSQGFCPLVFRTHAIDHFIALDLSVKAKELIRNAPPELISRAAAFLLLSDSKASFAIEGETPPKDRIARWGWVIGRAGKIELSINELVKLQRELIGDQRFVHIGVRREGGFIGRHDPFGSPEPEHVSADFKDLHRLLEGLVSFNKEARELDYDPVLSAASIAFGFVYIHPFEDGNGRIHRFLMHHVLADRKFTPEEIVFPISNVIFHEIVRYKDVLERVSLPLLPYIQWKSTKSGNIEIINETADYYRYFDATAHTEFLFRCIERAVDMIIPEELAFLKYRDSFHEQVTEIVDMSARILDLLLKFLGQNQGVLSKRARENEFARLSPSEIERIEQIYADLSAQ